MLANLRSHLHRRDCHRDEDGDHESVCNGAGADQPLLLVEFAPDQGVRLLACPCARAQRSERILDMPRQKMVTVWMFEASFTFVSREPVAVEVQS